VALRDVGDGRHVGRQAEQVDRADGSGARRDGRLDQPGIHVVGVGLDVDEDGRRARRQHGAARRVEGVTDRDDLVSGLEVERRVDRHERQRAVGDGDGMPHADELGPPLLELGDTPALGDHPAAQDLADRLDLFLADVGTDDGDHAGAPCFTTGPDRSSSVSPSGR
jgi:hypothetical protein